MSRYATVRTCNLASVHTTLSLSLTVTEVGHGMTAVRMYVPFCTCYTKDGAIYLFLEVKKSVRRLVLSSIPEMIFS